MNSYDPPTSHSYIFSDNFDYPSVLTSSTFSSTPTTTQPSLVVTGQAVFEKKVILSNGQDLEERLELIEQRLNIPTRDVKLEDKYERLRELAEQYKEELERCRTWEALKK